MSYVILFIAGFGSVFLLGFQSRNVNHGNVGWAAITSFAIAIMQVSLWGQIFSNLTYASAMVYGLSGSCGIVSSMYVHKRWIAKEPKNGRC